MHDCNALPRIKFLSFLSVAFPLHALSVDRDMKPINVTKGVGEKGK